MDDTDEFDDYADSGGSEDEDLAEAYYEAKEKKSSRTEDVVNAFEFVVTLEQREAQLTEWGFKALKQLLKLGAAKGSAEVLRNYKRILAYHSAVSDSQMEKACLKVLACLSDVESFREFGQTTNEGLRDAKPMLWSRMAMRLATTFFTGGHDDDALQVLSDVKNTVQDNNCLAAFADSLLLDVYEHEAEICIRKHDFERIAALHAAAESCQWAENPTAMMVINECFGVHLLLKSQYDLAERVFTAATQINHDEYPEHTLRCSQLLAMNAALRAQPDNDGSRVLISPQPTDSRVLAASELARRYRIEHGNAFLTAAQEFLAGDTDPLVACVLEQWTSKVLKAEAEIKNCLSYPLGEHLVRNAVFQSGRFTRLRKEFAAEPDEYIRKLCVTRVWAAELQYWLRLGEDDRVRDVVNKASSDRWSRAWDVQDASVALLREFCGRSFFEHGALDYAQHNFREALRHCSADRVHGCTQMLIFAGLLLGKHDRATNQNLEETTPDVLRQLTKHICTFEPADCARLLSDADGSACVDPFIAKSVREWIAKMEPVKECVLAAGAQQALKKSDYAAAMQRVGELKQKATDESNEALGLLCRMQLYAAELQFTHAAGDLRRLRDVLAGIPSRALMHGKVKVVDDHTSAAGIVREFNGRMYLFDGKVAAALTALRSAETTYSRCGSKRLAACKQYILFCRLIKNAAVGWDPPSAESADEALLELLVPLTAAIAKADLGAMRSIVDRPSFAKLANSGLHDAVSQWLEQLEDSNRILLNEGQVLVDGNDYFTVSQRLEDVINPVEIFDKLTRDTWTIRLWSLKVQTAYHSRENELVDGIVKRMAELSVSVQNSDPAGLVLEFSGKRYLRANDRPRALERFQRDLQIFEINESSRRFAIAGYIALTLRPNQRLSDHLHEQYASTAGVVAVRDLMDAYYADERDRFYELLPNAQTILLDAFIAERLKVHCETLKARICSRPIQLPTETWEVVLSMLRNEHASVQSACKKFRETFANIFNT